VRGVYSDRRYMRSSTFIQRGLPFILVVTGGWFGLSQMVSHRLDIQDSQRTYDERAPVEKQRAKAFDLNTELERIKTHHLDRREEYVNKAIERPKEQ
jgi:hypothetical protein